MVEVNNNNSPDRSRATHMSGASKQPDYETKAKPLNTGAKATLENSLRNRTKHLGYLG